MIRVYFLILFASRETYGQISGPRRAANDFYDRIPSQPTLYHGRTKREISSTKDGNGGHHSSVTLTVPVEGEKLVLDLILKENLLMGNYTVQYQKEGKAVYYKPTKEELKPIFCHYHGSVRGRSNSWAAVSTCNGITGVIYDETKTWFIESARDNDNQTTHFLYDHYALDRMRYRSRNQGVTNNNHLDLELTAPSTRVKQSLDKNYTRDVNDTSARSDGVVKTRYVKLVMVADHMMYQLKGDDLHLFMIQLVNIVDSIYSPLDIKIVLAGVVIWNEQDMDNMNSNANIMDDNFISYRNKYLDKIPNDHAQLLTGVSFYWPQLGVSYTNSICGVNKLRSGSVTTYYSSVLGQLAANSAHELGHVLAMLHDSEDSICPYGKCVMTKDNSQGFMQWSKNHKKGIQIKLNIGEHDCLLDMPSSLFNPSTCGNGILEPSEHCDCGVGSDARLDLCFQCCDNTTCRFKSSGTVCRAAVSECDPPEYCSGSSEYCPVDELKMTPFTMTLSAAVDPRQTIRVLASTLIDAKCHRGYIIELGPSNTSDDDVAYHVILSFNQTALKCFHRLIFANGTNTRSCGEVGGFPIAKGQAFELYLSEDNSFKVVINGTSFPFKHLIPERRITHLIFEDQIKPFKFSNVFKNTEK